IPGTDESAVLDTFNAGNGKLQTTLLERLSVRADGKILAPQIQGTEALTERGNVLLRLRYAWERPPHTLTLKCDLFSSDPRHKTFVNVYQDSKLQYQGILDRSTTQLDYDLNSHQQTGAMIAQFIREGVHHIFIGPDHILFIIGLLLLGGTIGQLLKIITAFTVAHSITLALATFNILSPSPRLIEPAIAASIVFVGVHAMLARKEQRDWRMIFAFGFGFIHGFGFANVLREMHLPSHALGWSLFSFNLGVEIGQACIVMAITPLLFALQRYSAVAAARVLAASAALVIFAGTFWFWQRLFV
ncbi:MAG: HupE/UreJ family protein, partial [Verrucomicrobiota bacterium]|nr:HupE/UreJ family protein [Verrucomicrobiota bacterium]